MVRASVVIHPGKRDEPMIDKFDPSTWPEYEDETHKAKVLQEADELGECGTANYEGKFDWERFVDRIESRLQIILPTDWTHPIFIAIKKTARKAWRESNG